MEVILKEDVDKVGHRGDIVKVAEGFGRNYLLPRKLAGEADKGAMAQLEAQQKAQARKEAAELAQARELAAKIEAAKLAVKAKAGGNGKLFGAITNADVANAIAGVLDVDIDKHKIEITNQIKALGSYPVEIKLHKGVVAKTVVDVVAA